MLNYFLFCLSPKSRSTNQGFTLIELLVTIVIVGVLSAISVPALLANIGKARETEATSILGSIVRSQHAFHFQTQTFATTMVELRGGVPTSAQYYDFPDPSVANNNLAKHQAIPLSPWNNASRIFAGGTYHNAGAFQTAICRAKAIGETVVAPNTPLDSCSNGGVRVK